MQRFKVQWDNGYDLKHDQWYNQWLEIHYPNYRICSKSGSSDQTEAPSSTQSPPLSGSNTPSKPSVLSSLLVVPDAPARIGKKRAGGVARVLTSKENLELLEVKEKKKLELEKQKQQRKEARERKAQEREEQKQLRKEEQERKAREKEEEKREKERLQQEKKQFKTTDDRCIRKCRARTKVQSSNHEQADSIGSGIILRG